MFYELIRFTATSSRGIDLQPIKGSSPIFAFFFIAFLILGSFVILNLFAGVVLDAFQKEKSILGIVYIYQHFVF